MCMAQVSSVYIHALSMPDHIPSNEIKEGAFDDPFTLISASAKYYVKVWG